MTGYCVAAFYHFVPVDDPAGVVDRLRDPMQRIGLIGSILVAAEGINGTIAGRDRADVETMLRQIADHVPGFAPDVKWSECDDPPFRRARVRLKREIVTIGDADVDGRDAADRVDPEQFNALIDDPDTILIDTRNRYEIELGTFDGAIDPGTESFGEFPDFVRDQLPADPSTPIAMFCTGGIRCEKATALLKSHGYRNVHHLRGGILNYLQTVAPEESRWRGDCYVFDQRVALDHRLKPSGHVMCHACGLPITSEQADDPRYEPGVQCPRCADQLSESQKARFRMRQSQNDAGE